MPVKAGLSAEGFRAKQARVNGGLLVNFTDMHLEVVSAGKSLAADLTQQSCNGFETLQDTLDLFLAFNSRMGAFFPYYFSCI